MGNFITQCKVLWHKKGFQLTFLFMLTIVFINFFENVNKYKHTQVSDLIMFPDFSVLSSSVKWGFYIIQFFPLLVPLPAAFSLANDKSIGIDKLWAARGGQKKYIVSKIVAVLFTTFLCFFIPLFIEAIMNVIAFPTVSHGSATGYVPYTSNYKTVESYYLFGLYFHHPFWYCVVLSGFFAGIAAMLSLIPLACSTKSYKYKAYLLIPVYFILRLTPSLISLLPKAPGVSNYFFYFQWCSPFVHRKDFLWFTCCVFFMSCISVGVLLRTVKKDVI